MKNWLLGMTAMVALTAGALPALADGELHIYNWGDYTNPKLIEKFEKQFNVKVTLDDYDSNETMLSKVREGNTGYDIVVPSDYTVKIMIEEGLLEKTEQRVPIQRLRVAADVPAAERTELEVLRTDTATFQALVESRRNRREEWFQYAAGRIELCNVPLAVRAKER